MACALSKDDSAEVGIDRDKDAILLSGPAQHHVITWIRTRLKRLDNVVPVRAAIRPSGDPRSDPPETSLARGLNRIKPIVGNHGVGVG